MARRKGRGSSRVRRVARPKPVTGVAVRVAVTYVAAESLLRFAADAGWFRAVQRVTAEAAGWLLRMVGSDAVVKGVDVIAGQGIVSVTPLCLPITPVALGLALILFAGPRPVKARAIWSAALLGALAIANVIRIFAVSLLAARRSALLEPVHEEVLPVILVGVAVAVWLVSRRQGARSA